MYKSRAEQETFGARLSYLTPRYGLPGIADRHLKQTATPCTKRCSLLLRKPLAMLVRSLDFSRVIAFSLLFGSEFPQWVLYGR